MWPWIEIRIHKGIDSDRKKIHFCGWMDGDVLLTYSEALGAEAEVDGAALAEPVVATVATRGTVVGLGLTTLVRHDNGRLGMEIGPGRQGEWVGGMGFGKVGCGVTECWSARPEYGV